MRITLSTVVSTLLLLATSANALPAKPTKQFYTPAKNLDKLAKLMPQSALSSPDGLQLKYVLLGIGTQNYTCTTGDENAAPGTTGASGKIPQFSDMETADNHPAKLYDIGTPLNSSPFAKWTIASISPLALSLMTQPAQLEKNLASLNFQLMVGHHFFTGGSPVFSLDQLQSPYPVTLVGKLGETDAPVSSCPGVDAEGAIKWLLLKDTKGVSQGGIDTVYRLETAGGNKPTTCKGKPANFEVKYAAQCKSTYHIYKEADY
jgi:hypothetical protein